MDGCIVERPKLLIWSKNTYKQKKKNYNGKRKVRARSINENG
jgi:hypothetical protein